ncbi:hypothetical protein GW7_07630 [Heterocephalus glaber]|uniref:Uncharacterized protein n=1 Tax=Heterocephalus glaber TaxID=10181 RepID=G5BYA4_HETGA|nr:hypothetical protein GW7_07630 [Heterocephalus glaber]
MRTEVTLAPKKLFQEVKEGRSYIMENWSWFLKMFHLLITSRKLPRSRTLRQSTVFVAHRSDFKQAVTWLCPCEDDTHPLRRAEIVKATRNDCGDHQY